MTSPVRSYEAENSAILVETLPDGDFLVKVQSGAVAIHVCVPSEQIGFLFGKVDRTSAADVHEPRPRLSVLSSPVRGVAGEFHTRLGVDIQTSADAPGDELLRIDVGTEHGLSAALDAGFEALRLTLPLVERDGERLSVRHDLSDALVIRAFVPSDADGVGVSELHDDSPSALDKAMSRAIESMRPAMAGMVRQVRAALSPSVDMINLAEELDVSTAVLGMLDAAGVLIADKDDPSRYDPVASRISYIRYLRERAAPKKGPRR